MFEIMPLLTAQGENGLPILGQYQVIIPAIVALTVVLLTKFLEGVILRRRHRRALLAEIKSMPFKDLYNYTLFAESKPREEITSSEFRDLKYKLYDTKTKRKLGLDGIHSCLSTRRYFTLFLFPYGSKFPTSVYDSTIGQIGFNLETSEKLVTYYSHVKEGEILFAPQFIRETIGVREETPLFRCADKKETLVLVKSFAEEGAELQDEISNELRGIWFW